MTCHNSFFSSAAFYASSQLRPVTYRGVCDLTPLPSISYSQNRRYGAPYSGSLSCSWLVASDFLRQLPPLWPFVSALAPFRENIGRRACTVVNTSVAKTLRGSETSTASHCLFPRLPVVASRPRQPLPTSPL